eukprot:8576308-Lingulodinium_polyedra.AAC.1
MARARSAPGSVHVLFGFAGANGRELLESVAWVAKPSCPLRSGASVRAILEGRDGRAEAIC